MLKLNSKQTSHLRALGHNLNPVVMIGNNGLSDQVLREIDTSLKAHEVIKIKVFSDDREQRKHMLETICEQLAAAPVHHIGKQLVVYRPADVPRIMLPK
ncbi:MAG: ribosome assembly RNA-binding protein YhbY [Methylobacillus sp.]|jgi:RNA-binding protein|nr:ribosome assembly RNA-binding protein YhbY [Methylobacillus sp.]